MTRQQTSTRSDRWTFVIECVTLGW